MEQNSTISSTGAILHPTREGGILNIEPDGFRWVETALDIARALPKTTAAERRIRQDAIRLAIRNR